MDGDSISAAQRAALPCRLEQLASELERQLATSPPRLRHAFFALSYEPRADKRRAIVDATLGAWLAGDRYERIVLGPSQFPEGKSGKTWQVTVADAGATDGSVFQWEATLRTLDEMSRAREMATVFPGTSAAGEWLPVLYGWEWVERRGAGLLFLSFPPSDVEPPSLWFGSSESIAFTLPFANQSPWPAGEQFVSLRDDVRLASLRAIRVIVADFSLARLAAIPSKGHRRGSRRPRRATEPKPLTSKQHYAIQVVGECNGKIAEAARRSGVDRKTMQQHFDAGMKKLRLMAIRHKTQPLRHDHRGQVEIADSDDCRRR